MAFVNKPKEGAKPNDKTHYGFVNFGDGTPLVQASIWLGKDRYGHAIVSGNTQYPLSKEEAAALQAEQPSADLLNAPEPKTARRAKAKADDHSRA